MQYHNDYSREVPPKFELFADRIEITSAGGLPEDLSKEEFFQGFSVPRNQEIMRIFKDLDMVEYLGSGVPRILEHYERSCFHFSDNFLRMVFPATESVTSQGMEEGNINEQFRNVQVEFGTVARRLAYNNEENITFYGIITG